MQKDNLITFTKENFDNINNIQLVKFKGRKATNFKALETFNPEDYVILFKENEKSLSSNYYCIVIINNKKYKLYFDQNLTILDNNFENKNIINNNETFFIKSIIN